jgi:argininosuccinate lyase
VKLWDKGYDINALIEQFTIGKDRELDLLIAPYDVIGTIAHVKMLNKIDLINDDELIQIIRELKEVYASILLGEFEIEDKVEDVHSQVEMMLTRKLGPVGKKVHTGRSRNDQVMLDIKLFTRTKIDELTKVVVDFFHLMIDASEKYKKILMPGYTHFQIAMPSSFGLWFGAYAESLTDDLLLLQSAYKIANQNPLGSAAGYGSSFPIDRQYTAKLLGFDDLTYNSIYAQMGRGKIEKIATFAIASLCSTLAKLAEDICIFMNQNFAFVSFPDEYTTGSSIMPHKKNPDVFELIRAKCNKIQALPNEINMITANLPSGYHRDFQMLKESYLPVFDEIITCFSLAGLMLSNVKVNPDILKDEKYDYLFSVEEVNKSVIDGLPFRDAYKMVGEKIQEGTFFPSKELHHVHEGSIGNLGNINIAKKMDLILEGFQFEKSRAAVKNIINGNSKRNAKTDG